MNADAIERGNYIVNTFRKIIERGKRVRNELGLDLDKDRPVPTRFNCNFHEKRVTTTPSLASLQPECFYTDDFLA